MHGSTTLRPSSSSTNWHLAFDSGCRDRRDAYLQVLLRPCVNKSAMAPHIPTDCVLHPMFQPVAALKSLLFPRIAGAAAAGHQRECHGASHSGGLSALAAGCQQNTAAGGDAGQPLHDGPHLLHPAPARGGTHRNSEFEACAMTPCRFMTGRASCAHRLHEV